MKHFCLDDSPRFRMIELESVDSTNTYLKGYRPLQQTDLTLVTAEFQTAGRGQTGNSWEAEARQNLLFSLMVHPTLLPACEMFVLSEAVALSVRETVEEAVREAATAAQQRGVQAEGGTAAEEAVTVKWPNDIYVGERKIAGILIENDLAGQRIGRSILGCGLNVNQRTFHLTGDIVPVSIAQLTGQETERRFLLENIVAGFCHRYEQIQRGTYADIHAEYRTVLYRREGMHPYRDASGTFLAEIADVEPSGHLLLRDSEGQFRRYAFKEVAFQHA